MGRKKSIGKPAHLGWGGSDRLDPPKIKAQLYFNFQSIFSSRLPSLFPRALLVLTSLSLSSPKLIESKTCLKSLDCKRDLRQQSDA